MLNRRSSYVSFATYTYKVVFFRQAPSESSFLTPNMSISSANAERELIFDPKYVAFVGRRRSRRQSVPQGSTNAERELTFDMKYVDFVG